jgi:diguanylate cyclase (GGDEF)-like protein
MGEFSEGRLGIRCPVSRRDEIGRLGMAFNRMADQHQRTHEHMVRLNTELEERVAERTEQLRDLASRDPLTGLYNRRHFSEVLERGFSEALRYETDLTCIMLDLDDFKKVNDDYGHHVGDEVLTATAGTIVAQLRSSDAAARFGGDEFIALLPRTGADQARILGERIVEQFSKDTSGLVPGRRLTLSMGIASLYTLDAADSEPLVQAADHALYQAKAAGKACIITADPTAKPLLP